MRVVFVLLALWPFYVSAHPQQAVHDNVIYYDPATNQIIPESESTSSAAVFPVLFLNAFAEVQEPFRIRLMHLLFKEPSELSLALELSSIFGSWKLNANERMELFVAYISSRNDTDTHSLKSVLEKVGIWMAELYYKATELSKNLSEEELQLVRDIHANLVDPRGLTVNELSEKIKKLSIALPATDLIEMGQFAHRIEEAVLKSVEDLHAASSSSPPSTTEKAKVTTGTAIDQDEENLWPVPPAAELPFTFINAVAFMDLFDSVAIIEKLFSSPRDRITAGVILGHLAAPELSGRKRARNLDAFIASLEDYDRGFVMVVLKKVKGYLETVFSQMVKKVMELPTAEIQFIDSIIDTLRNPQNTKEDVHQQLRKLTRWPISNSPRLKDLAELMEYTIRRTLLTSTMNDDSKTASPETEIVTNLNAFALVRGSFLNTVMIRLFDNEESLTHAMSVIHKLTEPRKNAKERVLGIMEYVESQEDTADSVEVIIKLELWMEKVLHEISVRSNELSPELQEFISFVHHIISNAEDSTDELEQKLGQLHLSDEARDELLKFVDTMEMFAYQAAAGDHSTSTAPPIPTTPASEDTQHFLHVKKTESAR